MDKKGHEFDDIGKNFANSDLYIYGFGIRGKELAGHLSFCDAVTGFIDIRAKEIKQEYNDKPIYTPYEFMKYKRENAIVVTAVQDMTVKKHLYAKDSDGVHRKRLFGYLRILRRFWGDK